MAPLRKSFVLATVSEGDLQRPDFFRMIGCQVHLGRPRKKATTLDYAVVLDLPRERTSFDVLNRLQEAKVGLISSEPIAGAILLVPLAQALEKRNFLQAFAILIEGENESWEQLETLKPAFVIFQAKNGDEATAFFSWLKERSLTIPVILRIYLTNEDDDTQDYTSLLTDCDGIWVDAPLSLEPRRHMGLNLLKGLYAHPK